MTGHLPDGEGVWILVSSLFSVFDDQLYNVPDGYQTTFPDGLPSAPIIACLVAFGCCTLPGFAIDPLQPIPHFTRLLAPPDDGEDGSGEDNSGDADDDPGDSDNSDHPTYDDGDGISSESQGSGSTVISPSKRGKGASFSSNSYLFGPPLQGLKLHVMADPAVSMPIYFQ